MNKVFYNSLNEKQFEV